MSHKSSRIRSQRPHPNKRAKRSSSQSTPKPSEVPEIIERCVNAISEDERLRQETRDMQEAGPSHALDRPFREYSRKTFSATYAKSDIICCFTKIPQLNRVYTGVVRDINTKKKSCFVSIFGLKGGKGGHVNFRGNNGLKNVLKVGNKVNVKVI